MSRIGVALMTSEVETAFTVNGRAVRMDVDPRASLLDVLRERLGLTGTKKGCDHGGPLHPLQQAFVDHDAMQCGYCTLGQVMSELAAV